MVITKKFYISAGMLLATATLATIFTGFFNPAALPVFSLIALALIYAPALWPVIVHTRDSESA